MGKRISYKNSGGKVLPSVTTITGRFKDAGGLIYWANEQGRMGKTLNEARQPAADSGTMAHDLVEAHINEWEEPQLVGDDEVVANARKAFEMYLKWEKQTKMRIEYTEVSLVSEKHQFGGRLDAIGIIDNQLCLVDWKSSNSVYADMLYQCAAYCILWEENYPDMPIVGGVHLCRFAKETPDFGHLHFGDVEYEKETFLLQRQLYDRVKKTEKRVK